jgi:hypothetical protein
MTLYYFNIREPNELIVDPEGQELPGIEAAREEALGAVRELMAERILAGIPLDGTTMEITNRTGEIVDRVPFVDAVVPR